MDYTDVTYFYSKLENNTDAVYPNGWDGWYFDLFKEPVHVLDSSGRDIIAEPDTVYIVPPMTPMYFKYEHIKSFVHTCILFQAERHMVDRFNIPYRTPVKIHNMPELERLLYSLEEYNISHTKFRREALSAQVFLILNFLYTEINDYEKNYKVKSGEDLRSLRNTIMNSLAFPWSVEVMASRANMSRSAFIRQYKKLYNKTPIADLYDMRFRKAKMLLETGYSIPWVLNSCCFKSYQHFSRFFKERAGISPSEYKKNCGK